jgi:hypothetical protein
MNRKNSPILINGKLPKVGDFRRDPEPIPLGQAEAEFKAKVDREIQRMTSDAARLNSGETPADHTGENTA